MKILFIDDTPCWLHSLPWGLESLGQQVMILQEIKASTLTQAIKEFKPNFVLTVGWGRLHNKENLNLLQEILKKERVFHCYWTVEDIDNIDTWSIPYVLRTQPELVLTINGSCLHRYDELGIPSAFLDFGCNPLFHHKKESQEQYRTDLAMVANAWNFWTNFRGQSVDTILRPLVELEKYKLAIWGKGWHKVPEELGLEIPEGYLRGKVPWAETANIYGSAKINLAIQNENRFSTQVTMRTYEILASQGFMITSRTKALERLFIQEKHLIMVNKSEETLDVVNYYLKHPKEREDIARRGQKEVYSHHTYKHRAKQLLEVVSSLLEGKGIPKNYREPYEQWQRKEKIFYPVGKKVASVVSSKLKSMGGNKTIYLGALETKHGHNSVAKVCFQVSSNLKEAREILKAQLRFWCIEGYNQEVKIALYKIAHPWSEKKFRKKGVSFMQSEPENISRLPKCPGWVSWDITKLLKEWQLGQKDNNGLLISLWPEEMASSYGVSLLSSDWGGASWFKPQLVVEYR